MPDADLVQRVGPARWIPACYTLAMTIYLITASMVVRVLVSVQLRIVRHPTQDLST